MYTYYKEPQAPSSGTKLGCIEDDRPENIVLVANKRQSIVEDMTSVVVSKPPHVFHYKKRRLYLGDESVKVSKELPPWISRLPASYVAETLTRWAAKDTVNSTSSVFQQSITGQR